MEVQPRIDSDQLSRNFDSMLERDKHLGRDDRGDIGFHQPAGAKLASDSLRGVFINRAEV